MTPSQSYKAALEAAAKVVGTCPVPLTVLAAPRFEVARETANEIARAIRALPVPEDAGDMVLVPREPTKAMQDAMRRGLAAVNSVTQIYRAMIDASEKQENS